MRSTVTERDLEIASWLGRHGMATAVQVMRRFGLQRSKAYQRLSVLVEHGLLRCEPGVRSARIYLATPAALRAVDLDLPAARVAPATAAHTLAVVDAAIVSEMRSTQFVATERELRRLDRRDASRFRLGVGEDPGLWPDLVVVDRVSDALHAVEVELTQKKFDRIAEKLYAYSVSSYETVTYRCATAGIARAVERSGVRAGLGERLRVERISRDSEAPSVVDDAAELLVVVRRERERAVSAERAAADAARQLDDQQRTIQAMLDDINAYLAADRAERAQIRRHWEQVLAGRTKVLGR